MTTKMGFTSHFTSVQVLPMQVLNRFSPGQQLETKVNATLPRVCWILFSEINRAWV